MTKNSLLKLTIAACLGAATMVAGNSIGGKYPPVGSELNADGAFRDGLYLGTMDAKQGNAATAATGRWARQADRDNFLAGYGKGYREFLASASANGNSNQNQSGAAR